MQRDFLQQSKLTSIAFQEDLKYSDFFRDHLPQHIGDIRREFFFMDLNGTWKADMDRPAQQS